MQSELKPFSFPKYSTPGFWRDYDFSPFAGYRRGYDWSPFADFRREVDQLFDDFFRTPTFNGSGYGEFTSTWPRLDFKESADEVIVTAEVPGMNEKDVELYFDNGMLTIRGVKKQDTDEAGYSERSYGRFERQIAMPYSVDGEHCTAEFNDGLLNIRFKKLAETENMKKIPINAGGRKSRRGREETADQARKPAFVSA